jgi:hypothetical protein
MKTILSSLLAVAALLCCRTHLLVAADTAPQQAPVNKTPARQRAVFQVSKTCIHYCTDQQEAERRWTATKEMTTADVFRFTGEPPWKRLDVIARAVAVHGFGGGTDADPAQFAIDVTPDEDKAIRDALAKDELFVIYYHYGW